MEKDLGYEELRLLAKQLQDRINLLAKDADDAQSEGIDSYIIAQSNSLEQARFAYENAHNDLILAARELLKASDEKAAQSVLTAYGKFGLKEI